MSKLVWDKDGERLYETGISDVALFVWDDNSSGEGSDTSWKYGTGVAWNGCSAVNESPDGGDPTDIWANNRKYLTLRSAENFKGSISAYMYPDEWEECDGSRVITSSGSSPSRLFKLHGQTRKKFGLVYKTLIGSDDKGDEKGFKIHIVYGATASPSSADHPTTTDSPEATEMSWDFETVPPSDTYFKFGDVQYKATAHIEISSLDVTDMSDLLEYIYGTDGQGSTTGTDPKLPSPTKLYSLLTT